MELKHGTLKLQNFNDRQQAKIVKAIDLVLDAVNSVKFKDRVLNYHHLPIVGYSGVWRWKKPILANVPKLGFYFAPGERVLSNEQVYNEIMSGIEEEKQSEPGTMDLHLVGKSKLWTSATAYGYPGQDMIVIYHWWVDQASIAELANTIFHEWLHNCRFEHTYEWTICRDDSVPYGVGQIVQEIIEERVGK